jgi:hypothetical protein
LEAAEKHNSHVSVVWHNHVFDPIEFPLLNKLYWKILRFANKNSGSIFSTDELWEYWQKKDD